MEVTPHHRPAQPSLKEEIDWKVYEVNDLNNPNEK